MATQVELPKTAATYHELKLALRLVTAEERKKEITQTRIKAIGRKVAKQLKEIRARKRIAEDACEAYRSQNNLEV